MKNNYITHREFVPIGLNPWKHQIKRKVAWGVAIKGDSYAHCYLEMVEGPFYTEEEALQVKGVRGARIIFFMENGGDRITHYWHNNHWVKKRRDLWKMKR